MVNALLVALGVIVMNNDAATQTKAVGTMLVGVGLSRALDSVLNQQKGQ